VVQRHVHIRYCLRFDALGRIHHQKRAFAGRQAARDFVGKIDMAGSINQIELVFLTVLGPIAQAHRTRFDCDAAFPLQLHAIENLRGFLAVAYRAGKFQQPVSQRRLAMVDMSDDRKISNML
jgi:hypothetical protein